MKPDVSPAPNPYVTESAPERTSFSRGTFWAGSAHPHMASKNGRRSWLEVGDPFAVNRGHIAYEYGDIGVVVRVLLNDDFVPFRLVEVTSKDGYPSRSELDLENRKKLVQRKRVTLEDRKPFNFTLAVPSSAFDDGSGVYDLRVLWIPQNSEFVRRGLRIHPHGTDGTMYRVHYGGCRSLHGARGAGSVNTTKVEWTPKIKQYVGEARGLFLAPSDSMSNWRMVSKPENSDLSQTLDVQNARNEATFTLFPLLASAKTSSGIQTGGVTYLVFRDDRLVRRFEMQPNVVESRDREYYDESSEMRVAKFTLSLEKGTHTYSVMALYNRYGGVPRTAGPGIASSNLLRVTRKK